jgi:long-chain acyl-CoA synthetase
MSKKIEPHPLTLKSILENSVRNFGDLPSVSYVDGNPMTYSELGKKVNDTFHLLQSLGLKKGDKVALLGQSMPNWVVAYFSVVSKGLVIVPVLPDFTSLEIENVLVHSGAKVLFVSDKLVSRIENLITPELEAVILLNDFSLMSGTVDPKIKKLFKKIH